MTGLHLLEAMGLLDDDLIQEAERYSRPKSGVPYGKWLGLAASFAVVIVLGYGLTHLGGGGGKNGAGGSGAPPAAGAPGSTAAGESRPADDYDYNGASGGGENSNVPAGSAGQEPGPAKTGRPAIMVDGMLYCSTGEAVPVEVDESAVKTASSYTDAMPETDGQTNFSPDLSARYAMVERDGERELVVQMEQEWILFEPAPF